MFVIGGIQKTTLLDFPERVAAIVFTKGCNFRCGYCHNPELIEFSKESDYDTESFFEFLKTRLKKLDGVVITGGEPTLQSGLYDFVKRIKSMGFEVKLDTNGTNPQVLKKLISDNLLDYIAMDIKAPEGRGKYNEITQVSLPIESISESIKLIMDSGVDYEFRTTVVKSQLSVEDFDEIGKMIKGAKRYYLQKFIPSKCLNEALMSEKSYSDEELKTICENLKKYIETVDFR